MYVGLAFVESDTRTLQLAETMRDDDASLLGLIRPRERVRARGKKKSDIVRNLLSFVSVDYTSMITCDIRSVYV